MHLASEGDRIDDPNPFDSKIQIFPDFFQRFRGGVFRGKNLDAQMRWSRNNTANDIVWSFADDTDIGNSKMIRAGLDPLFRHRKHTQAAANSPQLTDQKTLYRGVFPGWHRTFDYPSFHELGIVLEARVEVPFGANQLGDSHNLFYIRNSMT